MLRIAQVVRSRGRLDEAGGGSRFSKLALRLVESERCLEKRRREEWDRVYESA